MEAVENITKYQDQTKKWRDSQVIRKLIQYRDLVLRRNLMQKMLESFNQNGKAHTWRGPSEDPGHSTWLTAKAKQQLTPRTSTVCVGSTSKYKKGGLRGTISEGHQASPSFRIFFTFHAKGPTLFSSQKGLLTEVRFLTRQVPCKTSKNIKRNHPRIPWKAKVKIG